MSIRKEPRKGGHYFISPTTLSEAIVQGLAMQTAKHLVKKQDEMAAQRAQEKSPEKIGGGDS